MTPTRTDKQSNEKRGAGGSPLLRRLLGTWFGFIGLVTFATSFVTFFFLLLVELFTA